ncbi:acetyltransferase [Leucobacter sp. wl10]|nr:acetyltransferase [Leucobacter sp. wl10]
MVIGAGGFGRETLDVIEAWNQRGEGAPLEVLGVVDDAPTESNLERLARRGYEYLGDFSALVRLGAAVDYLIGVGNPATRAAIAAKCDAHGLRAGAVVHPSASVGSDTAFADGTVICGGVQVSTNVRMGRHTHLNPGCIIGHDTALDDFVSVNPGAIVSGDVSIRDRVLVGAGAVVLQGLSVGARATVGAGACVTRDVAPCTVVSGVPARAHERESGT